jgi:DNA-binding NtrC family response regulator
LLLPLRARLEEIPWLVAAELARVRQGLAANVSFVEACMLRPWPGNVRELLGEVRRAGHDAIAADRAVVDAKDLGDDVGRGFPAPLMPVTQAGEPQPAAAPLGRAEVEEALRAARGNVTSAARALGLHRNQLRRWLARNGVDVKALGLGSREG